MAQQVKNPSAMQETQDMWVQFLGQKDPLEEGMASHSNILACKIPLTEEPGGLLQSVQFSSVQSLSCVRLFETP